MSPKQIVKEVNDYKIENELTKSLVFEKQIKNFVHHKIKRIFSHNFSKKKQQFEEDGIDTFFDRTTKTNSVAKPGFGLMGSLLKYKAGPTQLPIIQDHEKLESDLVSQSDDEREDENDHRCSTNEDRKLNGSE